MRERSNEEWLKELSLDPPQCNPALSDLRTFIYEGLKSSFSSSNKLDADILEDYTQESIHKILEKISTFRAEAKLSSWAMKIAVNLVLSDLRKKEWENISFDGFELPERFIAQKGIIRRRDNPETRALKQDLIDTINSIIAHDLTEKQRRAMALIMIQRIPLRELASRMHMKRGALYKLLHDARKKIRGRLIESGYTWQEIEEIMG